MNAKIGVVLADDQELIREALAMLLSAEGDIEILGQVSDGQEAVRAARSLNPQIVVMDVRMPMMNGIEATRRITRDNADRPDDLFKVIGLTTFDDDESIYGMLRAGASGFLLKHAAPQELPMAIRRVASGESWIDPMVAGRVIKALGDMSTETNGPFPQLESLTPRELEVLKLVGSGMNNAEIAEKLFLSEATVKTHISRILLRTGCRDRPAAVALAFRSGLVSTNPTGS